MTDARPDLDTIRSAFAVAATVILPGESESIATNVIIGAPSEAPARSMSEEPARWNRVETAEELKEATFVKAEVSSLPIGSRLVITEGVDAGTYSVDRLVYDDAEIFTVRLAEVAP
jgi:hypothetical protein